MAKASDSAAAQGQARQTTGELASYDGEQCEVHRLRSKLEKWRQEHAAKMQALQGKLVAVQKVAEQVSTQEHGHEQLKELLGQRTAECKQLMQQQQGIEQANGVLRAEMAKAAVGNKAVGELEEKLCKSEEKVETLEAELRRLRQGCQHGAILRKELAENQMLKAENERLKAEPDELQKEVKEEIEAQSEARTAEPKNLQEELSAYGGEWQEQEAMEELAMMESKLTANQMELSHLQVAFKEAKAAKEEECMKSKAAMQELEMLKVTASATCQEAVKQLQEDIETLQGSLAQAKTNSIEKEMQIVQVALKEATKRAAKAESQLEEQKMELSCLQPCRNARDAQMIAEDEARTTKKELRRLEHEFRQMRKELKEMKRGESVSMGWFKPTQLSPSVEAGVNKRTDGSLSGDGGHRQNGTSNNE